MKLNFKKLVDKITDKKQPLNDRFRLQQIDYLK